jgi:hypothetical protein
MAYEFNGTTQYLSAGATATALPFTMACWIYAPANALCGAISFGRGAGQTDRHILGLDVNKSFVQSGDGFNYSTNTYSANTWTHIAGTFESGSAQPWLGGVGGTTITPTVFTPTETIIAARRNNTIGAYFPGRLAEVGIWNAALTAAEVASLARGMTCYKVRPQSLVFYAPLVRDLIDAKGGRTITNNNSATVANHPRVYA